MCVLYFEVESLYLEGDAGFVPVISPIGTDKDENTYNINADYAASAVAGALNAQKLISTAEKVMKEGIFHISNLYYNKYTVIAAERLNKAAQSDRVFFANSGAEANEAALKLSRKYGFVTGRTKVLSFEHSFHGRTYGAITLTG